MAPDLDTVSLEHRTGSAPSTSNGATTTQPPSAPMRQPSQGSVPGSRRASQIYPMNPPPLPLASSGAMVPASAQSGHNAFPPLSPSITSNVVAGESGSGVPVRHPRPMTPAEMHLELEKEQEAIVNRLTRELSALRAHSSSVASTNSIASSSTNGAQQTLDPLDPTLAGSNHPAQSRNRHRSSSSVSNHTGQHRPLSLSGPSAADPTVSTPSAASRAPSTSNASSTAAGGSHVPTTQRYEEVMLHRQELDEAKRENERLRRRVRELEALVRGRRDSTREASATAAERVRSASVQRDEAGMDNAAD